MKFEIGEVIGRGGMGLVYRAKQVGLDRELAVKVIHAELMENEDAVNRFLTEARLTAQIDHPNVVRVYDSDRDDSGRPYILMELLSGESLQQRLLRGNLSEKATIEIAKQVLRGLGEAHAKGIVHRDIKPANIFLTTSGVVKIVDFGIAKALGSNQMTGFGLRVGTPEYMSPEQAEGKAVDRRTDLYSLGIMLYEMVSGVAPFTAETPASVLYQHVHETIPELPSTVSPLLRITIVSLLRKSPTQRPQDAAQVLAMIEGRPIPKAKSDAAPVQPGAAGKPGRKGGPATEYFASPDLGDRRLRNRSRAKKAILGASFVVLAAAIAGFAIRLRNLTMENSGAVNLSLRIHTGQKFRVVRQRTLRLGQFEINTVDIGLYAVKTVRSAPFQISWTTLRDRSLLQVGNWTKQMGFGIRSTSLWPSAPKPPDSGWALSPATLNAKDVLPGQGAKIGGGVKWKLKHIETVAGHSIGSITFSDLPGKLDIVLELAYMQAIAKRINEVKGVTDWLFPLHDWRMNRVEDKVDLSTGIPVSMHMEQTHQYGFKLDTLITMTPSPDQR